MTAAILLHLHKHIVKCCERDVHNNLVQQYVGNDQGEHESHKTTSVLPNKLQWGEICKKMTLQKITPLDITE